MLIVLEVVSPSLRIPRRRTGNRVLTEGREGTRPRYVFCLSYAFSYLSRVGIFPGKICFSQGSRKNCQKPGKTDKNREIS